MVLHLSQYLLGCVSSILTCLCLRACVCLRVSERTSLCVSMAAWLIAAFELCQTDGGGVVVVVVGGLKPIWHGSSLRGRPAPVQLHLHYQLTCTPRHVHTFFIFTDLLQSGSILMVPAVLHPWRSSSCSSSLIKYFSSFRLLRSIYLNAGKLNSWQLGH